ncbi:MAG: FAD-dependent monooxygenase, partial [Acidimicrobiales bacterium]
MTNDFDVVVVGAGPAGCAAATTLARGGNRVLLADRARFPRDKCCGDGLTTAATRRLDALGLDPADVASFRPAAEFAVRSPSGRIIRFPLGKGPGVYAAVARRTDLDAALVALARRHGATVREGTR